MLAHVVGDSPPHQWNQRFVTKILARAGAPQFQKLTVQALNGRKIEFMFGIEANAMTRPRTKQQPVSADDLS